MKLLAVLVLVLLNGFFVAAEFALVKIRDTQLDPLIAKGHRRARIARRVIRNLDASLSACQLGITLASLALGWVGEPVFGALLTPVMDWLKIDSVTVRIDRGGRWLQRPPSSPRANRRRNGSRSKAAADVPWWCSRWLVPSNFVPADLVVNHARWLLRRMGLPRRRSGTRIPRMNSDCSLPVRTSGRRGALGRDIVLNARSAAAIHPRRCGPENRGADTGQITGLMCGENALLFPCESGDLTNPGASCISRICCHAAQGQTGRDPLPPCELIYVPKTARLESPLFLDRKLHMASSWIMRGTVE